MFQAGMLPKSIFEAYATQALVADQLISANGGEQVGYKVAAASSSLQEELGLTEPFRGQLLSHSIHKDQATLSAADLEMFKRRTKATKSPSRLLEIGLLLELKGDIAPLGEDGHDASSVAASVVAATPYIEILMTSFRDWVSGTSKC